MQVWLWLYRGRGRRRSAEGGEAEMGVLTLEEEEEEWRGREGCGGNGIVGRRIGGFRGQRVRCGGGSSCEEES